MSVIIKLTPGIGPWAIRRGISLGIQVQKLGSLPLESVKFIQWNLDLTNLHYNEVLSITNDSLYPSDS